MSVNLAMHKTRLTPKELLGVFAVLMERNLKRMTRFSVSMVMGLVSTFSDAAISAFLGAAMIGGAAAAQIGGDYISYVIIGLALSQTLSTSIGCPLRALSDAYWSMQMEPILSSPVSIQTVMVADSLWRYLTNLVNILIYILVGWLFGMKVNVGAGAASALGVLILGSISVSGFGLISAAMFSLINAKGFNEPVEWLIQTLQRLVCGIYFPVVILPHWLQPIGNLMPQTYVVDTVRRLLITDYPRSGTLPLHHMLNLAPQTINLLAIIALGVMLVPFGLWVLNKGILKARQDGGLSRWT